MVSYKIVNLNKARGDVISYCDILETTTNQLLLTSIPLSDAKDRCKELNYGAVFDGWTPAFFLVETKINKIDAQAFFRLTFQFLGVILNLG